MAIEILLTEQNDQVIGLAHAIGMVLPDSCCASRPNKRFPSHNQTEETLEKPRMSL